MTFQFKTRPRESPHEECEKEMTLLRDYNKALQKENDSRNEERKALQAEIERLTRHEREWKEGSTLVQSQVHVIAMESKEYMQLKEQYNELKSKYENLLIENSTLTSRIITSEYSTTKISSFQSQRIKLNETIRTYESKINSLQIKLLSCERELVEVKSKQSTTSTTITRQYQDSLTTIQDLQRQLRNKSELIGKLEFDVATKEDLNKALQKDISTYSLKIEALSDQLARLQRSHKVETVRIVQREDPTLRSRIDQLSNLNNALTTDNVALRGQADYSRELQRRIALLEDTNRHLQEQLRVAIQARGTASRVQLQEDRSLKQVVYALKAELQEVRSFNQLVRQENDELYAQLQLMKSSSHHQHGHSRCQRCKHRHKSRSRSPIRQEKAVIRTTLTQTFSALQANPSKISANHASHCSLASHSHTFNEKSRVPSQNSTLNPPAASSQLANDRYNDLQRKIQMLQGENQVLKQKLVYQI